MCAVPSIVIFVWLMCYPGMTPWKFLNGFEMVPVSRLITGINFFFYIPHALHFYCKVFRLYFIIFSESFLITLLFPEIAEYINIYISFFIIMDYIVRFIVTGGSVSCQLFVPEYGCVTFVTYFY